MSLISPRFFHHLDDLRRHEGGILPVGGGVVLPDFRDVIAQGGDDRRLVIERQGRQTIVVVIGVCRARSAAGTAWGRYGSWRRYRLHAGIRLIRQPGAEVMPCWMPGSEPSEQRRHGRRFRIYSRRQQVARLPLGRQDLAGAQVVARHFHWRINVCALRTSLS